MDKVIPILPCPNLAAQVEFFNALGFKLIGGSSYYAVMEYGNISLHFWVNKKLVPAENPTMCLIQTEDVYSLCDVFTNNLKAYYEKIPRTGAPKITKVRELSEDYRFTLTDTGGNTFYICMPRTSDTIIPLRTLGNEKYAKDFAVLYDLMYSKESPETAARFLPKLTAVIDKFDDIDKAKLLLINFDIATEINQIFDDKELSMLLKTYAGEGDWSEIQRKYETLKTDRRNMKQ